MRLPLLLAAAALLAGLAACDGPSGAASAPPPREPDADTVAQFCGMLLREHGGPKGQAIVEGRAEPLWFASARDTLAFTRLPDEGRRLLALYVSDMGRAATWDRPEPGAWVEARQAFYVIGSSVRAGMGTAEAMPFADRDAAEAFRGAHGGTIHAFADVPERFLLGDAARESGHAAD